MSRLFRLNTLIGLALILQAASIGLAQNAPAPTAPAIPAQGNESTPSPSVPHLTPLAPVPNWEVLKKYQGLITRAQFEEALKNVYQQLNAKEFPWKLEDQTLILQTSPGQAPLELPFRSEKFSNSQPQSSLRYWRTAKELPALKEGEPLLKGVNIALDPGHIGGEYARMEERFLSQAPGEAVMEGSLMLQLAKLLKPRLEALGATVTLVRTEEEPVTSQRPEHLLEAAKKVLLDAGIANPLPDYTADMGEQKVLTIRWQAEKLFYRVSEIRARAEKVNQNIRPDVVLALHLNAEAWADPQNPSFVDRNHLHLLVNGCFSANEIQQDDIRFDLIHRIFQNISSEEIPLAKTVAQAMQAKTHLPAYVYQTPNARPVEGSDLVYARNLLANRLYQCPVLFFEPYVMNHELTYKRLLLGHFIGETWFQGQWVTSPLEDYARGVVEGLKIYYKQHRRFVKP